MNARRETLLGVALCAAVSASVPAAEPVLGKSPRYCNPLPMVSEGGASASGDVTVIRDNGKYYMYCTGGGTWISERPRELDFPARRQRPRRAGCRQVQRRVLHVRQRRAAVQSRQSARALHQPRRLAEHARRGRRLERRVRHAHLHRRRQQAVSLLSRPRRQRHLRRAARPQRPDPIRRPAQAPLRLQQGPRVGTLRRDERVHRRGLDRRPVDAETQRHLLSRSTPPRARSGRRTPKGTTRREARWGRSPTLRTTRSCAEPKAS